MSDRYDVPKVNVFREFNLGSDDNAGALRKLVEQVALVEEAEQAAKAAEIGKSALQESMDRRW
jgi:hypothetical protein